MKTRTEKDTLGEVKVPQNAYYGAQTQRAVENFCVSGLHLPATFVWAQAAIKRAAAKANCEGGGLPQNLSKPIVKAADEVLAGKYADQFVVDVFQAGAGTSQNMNVNEVLANRAEEILGGQVGQYKRVHPNDHVNMGQSTNDTIHAAMHIAACRQLREKLLPELAALDKALSDKAKAFDDVIKTGRTHLQDAVPVRLSQEFAAYATMCDSAHKRILQNIQHLSVLCLGGTAVGTGLNTVPGYLHNVYKHLNKQTGFHFRPAKDLFAAMQSMEAIVELSGSLRILAINLSKIADDLRLLASGPRSGLGEITLPAVQPGSSIMPGKVNPVLPEMLNQVCFHVFGCDSAILHGARSGQLELNVMMPAMSYQLLQSIEILTGGMHCFRQHCVIGIAANRDICRLYAERSPAVATALAPHIGYQKAAALAKEALARDLLISDLVREKKLLPEDKLKELLDLTQLTQNPGAKD